ncbi:MAG TPA: paraquat-inducible protein A [Candidatus Didemnitutus sp.]|nr:paraquat-inducible protein A [Candidatus Didemnitutus sp.]
MQCSRCGQKHDLARLQPGQRALCVRCGSVLAERGWAGPASAFVFGLTALVLAIPAFALPLVTLRKFGNARVSFLDTSFSGLWSHDYQVLATWVLFCGALAPVVMLGLVVALRRMDPTAMPRLNSWLRATADQMEYWSTPEVQLLGILVAFFKLGDLVDVTVNAGLICFGAMAFFALLAWRAFSLQAPTGTAPPRSEAESVASPSRSRLAEVTALTIAAVILLFPAYALPVMHLGIAGHPTSDTTIFTGIQQLWRQGLGVLAAIVFTASFLVPLLKLAALTVLLVSAHRGARGRGRLLTHLYGMIDFIGRWSMLDVFLVAFLVGAVQFGKLASVRPDVGILAFAAVVVLTMLATRRFDPRVLWIGSGVGRAAVTG